MVKSQDSKLDWLYVGTGNGLVEIMFLPMHRLHTRHQFGWYLHWLSLTIWSCVSTMSKLHFCMEFCLTDTKSISNHQSVGVTVSNGHILQLVKAMA